MERGAAAGDTRTAVLVLGMHRSGTSVLTRLIGLMGAALPRDPNPAAPDNPEGYWEPVGIVQLNDKLLLAADSAWVDTRPLDLLALGEAARHGFAKQVQAALKASFGEAGCFVLKDPRICRMVPFYREVLEAAGIRVKVVIALRRPAEVAASLYDRNQISPQYTGHLWARHLLEAERSTRDLPRIFVTYDQLVADWRGVSATLRGFLGDALAPVDLAAVASPVRAELYHHRSADPAGFGEPLAGLLREFHDALLGMGADCGAAAGQRKIDQLAAEIRAAAAAQEAVLEAEFCCQRLMSPYDTVAAPDPLGERRKLAAALGRLHRLAWPHAAETAGQKAG